MLLDELRERIPLIEEENLKLYTELQNHSSAPSWNYVCGDRITENDRKFIEDFSEKLQSDRRMMSEPDDSILKWILEKEKASPHFRKRLKYIRPEKYFHIIETMSREDISVSLSEIVPDGSSFDRLVINPTSGTTGHIIQCPNHPASVGCYSPMLLYALERHSVFPVQSRDTVLAMQLGFQKETAVYSTVQPILSGSGFAKINLDLSVWKKEEDRISYIERFQPEFFTGNPVSFQELTGLGLRHRPKGFISTSLQLSTGLQSEMRNIFNAPVINFYSMNETGPLAYSCPVHPERMHILPADIYMEIIDPDGNPLQDGEFGEITVTGGRNPFLPLLRYRTGDFGKMRRRTCECGEKTGWLEDFEGRKPVIFKASDGTEINPVDVSRIFRKYPIVQYQLIQRKDGLNLKLHPSFPGGTQPERYLLDDLKKIFGDIRIFVSSDIEPHPVSGKVVSYASDL
ncbi:MAG TPA: AMP-binding protein [Leptospiraceae bacterium]|nr:AMP-binding protein [Leptospiraceae bacterium]HNF14980.1 AMP-binding protein [Leptospiraceae bacterium]HNF25543.1 AMP-binding protein [Leptospiraceae bacterium]HNI26260.1 AMP-binding protein [Leptospiraceae bacterium]HNI96086.1 AMP-binding protein [Leptospiraceae bacterium]